MRRAFCRWRLAVWTRRLNRRRAIWSDVRLSTEQNIHWEAQVTKAQARMVKWRRRAGLSRNQGGPVYGGRPYVVGEQRRKDKP